MLELTAAVRGWTPHDPQGDEIEVTAAGTPKFQIPNYHHHPHRSLSPPPPKTQIVDLSNCDDEKWSRKKMKKDSNQPPRPSNCFMLFRSDYVKNHSGSNHRKRVPGAHSNMTLSTRASAAWKALPESEKAHWEKKAKLEKEAHALAYPDYQYRPRKRGAAKAFLLSQLPTIDSQEQSPPLPQAVSSIATLPPPPALHQTKPRPHPTPSLRAFASERKLRPAPQRAEPPRARSEEDPSWLPIQAMQFSIPLNNTPLPLSPPINYAYATQSSTMALSPAGSTYESPIFSSSGSSLANWNGSGSGGIGEFTTTTPLRSYPASPSPDVWLPGAQAYTPPPPPFPEGHRNLETLWTTTSSVPATNNDCHHIANQTSDYEIAHQYSYPYQSVPFPLSPSHPSPLDAIPESIFDGLT